MNQLYLTRVEDFVKTEVEPIANDLDSDHQKLLKVFNQFKQLDTLALLIPQELGGLGGDRQLLVQHQMLLSNYSAALVFLQTQHQNVIQTLSAYSPTEKSEGLLKRIAAEKYALGNFLSAERRLTVVKSDDGEFRLSGVFPWVSGYTIFDDIFIPFRYNDDRYYTVLPFRSCQMNGGVIQCSDVIQTVVANSANTVRIDIDNWLISKDQIVLVAPPDQQDIKFPHPAIYNLAGVSQALLSEATKSYYFDAPFFQKKYIELHKSLDHYIEKIVQPIENSFDVRAQGRKLAMNCSEFARLTLSGSSLLPNSRVKRLCQEVWLHSIIAFQPQQLEAYLAGITD